MTKREDAPAPMPSKILVGDRIKLSEKRQRPYTSFYGSSLADKKWRVMGEDFVSGRRRLRVDDVPTLIWSNDAKLAYAPQSKERRELLTAAGAKLP